jgi:hypothetical protein
MAPQNLSQVFIANVATNPAAFDTKTAANASAIGVYSVSGPNAGTVLATALTAETTIQFFQTMPSGTATIASPLIDVKDIKRINYNRQVNPIAHAVPVTCASIANAGDSVMVRIALRTAPTAYANYYQDGTALDITTPNAYEFPLLGNFSAGRMIFNVELNAATAAGNATQLTNFINDNPTLKKIFTVSGTPTVTITARHAGVVFDVTVQALDGADTDLVGPSGFSVGSTTGFLGGVGNYYQALSDEKSMRAKYGNFNRMYFPATFPTFAQSGVTYDVLEISYEHGHPSSTGIARAGELNTIKIYVVETALGSTTLDTTFGIGASWGVSDLELMY